MRLPRTLHSSLFIVGTTHQANPSGSSLSPNELASFLSAKTNIAFNSLNSSFVAIETPHRELQERSTQVRPHTRAHEGHVLPLNAQICPKPPWSPLKITTTTTYLNKIIINTGNDQLQCAKPYTTQWAQPLNGINNDWKQQTMDALDHPPPPQTSITQARSDLSRSSKPSKHQTDAIKVRWWGPLHPPWDLIIQSLPYIQNAPSHQRSTPPNHKL